MANAIQYLLHYMKHNDKMQKSIIYRFEVYVKLV